MSALTGEDLPHLVSAIPGPRSVAHMDVLAASECPAITARRARRKRETGVGQDPIVWAEALGANVADVDGNVYVDLTAAFAVSGLGHRHPGVVAAAHAQLDRLIHAMGDVYPSDAKVGFTQALSACAPGELKRSILGMSGADAVDAALKTAAIKTGKPGVLAFWGGYHGLSTGALGATAYRDTFRQPFLGQLNAYTRHVPYPDTYRPPMRLGVGTDAQVVCDLCLGLIDELLSHPASGAEAIGAILIEPIQGRGGEVEPPPGFLAGLKEICDRRGLVLIFDEIYTGFARTGDLFACEHEGVLPDVMCVGKAMGGGFPISAAIGTPEVMDAWGDSRGEAVHTSTFLGNPLGCAMARASIDTIVGEGWAARVAARGEVVRARLESLRAQWPDRIGLVRGRGLMLGLDLVKAPETREPDGALALQLMGFCRARGYLVLPSGVSGNILALSPPFVITDAQLDGFFATLAEGLHALCGPPSAP